jgi:hypothetical protein
MARNERFPIFVVRLGRIFNRNTDQAPLTQLPGQYVLVLAIL